jgi:hypothetical protein
MCPSCPRPYSWVQQQMLHRLTVGVLDETFAESERLSFASFIQCGKHHVWVRRLLECCRLGIMAFLTIGKSCLNSSIRSISLVVFCSVNRFSCRSSWARCSSILASRFCLIRTTVAVNNAPRLTIPCSQENGAGSNATKPNWRAKTLAATQSETKIRMEPLRRPSLPLDRRSHKGCPIRASLS